MQRTYLLTKHQRPNDYGPQNSTTQQVKQPTATHHSRCSRADMCCFTSPGSAGEQARTPPLIPVLVLVEGTIYDTL